jgi:DNA replication and repair protein RecF
MYLTTLKLHHFRNHLDSLFEFGDGTNVLLGDNGQGKTNVIEAISYLCLTKSFYASSDALVLNFENDVFDVEGMMTSDAQNKFHIRVAYSAEQAEKVYTVNRHPVEPFSSVVGKFPIVICSPEHAPITTQGPLERRKFVDFVISQSNGTYFTNLMEYRRIVKHRNKILLDAKLSRKDISTSLVPWDEQLVTYGSALMQRRRQFVEEFQSFITAAYHHLVGREEEPTIRYSPMCAFDDAVQEDEIQNRLRSELQKRSGDEKRLGTSLVGPHRDEFELQINGLDLRKFASQGQHKTFLVALKIGEFFYLKDRCRETPIMLLDDIFSELDEHRAKRLLNFVETVSQTFITSTNPHYFESAMFTGEKNKLFHIHGGTVAEQKPVAA